MASRRKTRPGNWARLDTKIAEAPKILELLEDRGGLEAAAVYVFSIGWCKERGTDGTLPKGVLRLIHGTRKHADLLVKHELWETRRDGGWRIPARSYAAWQDTADDVEAARAAKAAAGARAACRKWHAQPCTNRDCPAVDSNVIPLQIEEAHHG
jgi:hypothetical protein